MANAVTSKGLVTIPKAIRERLGIQPGDAVEFELAADGQVVLIKVDGERDWWMAELRGSRPQGLARSRGAFRAMTEEQLELLRDKYVVWDRAACKGAMDQRDYNRRCADALKQLLAEHSEGIRAPSDGVLTEAIVRRAYEHFQHDAHFPCSASAMREAIELADIERRSRVSSDGEGE